jgi:TusA-related sulfurtransferase
MTDARVTAEKNLDLAGEVCPYTFVKSKLALEQMEGGQVLSIRVDNSESASNVPRSLELEGHEVIHVQKDKGAWTITVRKVLPS